MIPSAFYSFSDNSDITNGRNIDLWGGDSDSETVKVNGRVEILTVKTLSPLEFLVSAWGHIIHIYGGCITMFTP